MGKKAEIAKDTYTRNTKVIADQASRKMLAAQNSMEERIKWRFTHGDVVRQEEEHIAGRIQFYKKRQLRQQEIQAASDNSAAMRREVRDLREIHRLLTKRQVRRKQDYLKSVNDRILMEK